jgi:hypothetical protein
MKDFPESVEDGLALLQKFIDDVGLTFPNEKLFKRVKAYLEEGISQALPPSESVQSFEDTYKTELARLVQKMNDSSFLTLVHDANRELLAFSATLGNTLSTPDGTTLMLLSNPPPQRSEKTESVQPSSQHVTCFVNGKLFVFPLNTLRYEDVVAAAINVSWAHTVETRHFEDQERTLLSVMRPARLKAARVLYRRAMESGGFDPTENLLVEDCVLCAVPDGSHFEVYFGQAAFDKNTVPEWAPPLPQGVPPTGT